MRSWIYRIGLTALLGIGVSCSGRSAPENAPASLEFKPAGKVELNSKASYAQKRGFADFNADGLTDMVEISDEDFFGQSWEAKFFLGSRSDDGLLEFKNPYVVELPLKAKWFSSKLKLDTGDLNGDGAAEIIMTQYFERIGKDEYKIAVAINRGDGKEFVQAKGAVVEPLGTAGTALQLAEIIVDAVDDFGGYSDDINDYLKIDWADMNGDGKDDLCIFWDDWNDLYIDIYHSVTKEDDGSVRFQPDGNAYLELPNFMRRINIRRLDTEDFTGDGKADIVLFDAYRASDKIRIGFARNAGASKTSGAYRFIQHKDWIGMEIDVDSIGFEKRDSFDLNGDGIADYVHAGTDGSKRVLTYLLTKNNDE